MWNSWNLTVKEQSKISWREPRHLIQLQLNMKLPGTHKNSWKSIPLLYWSTFQCHQPVRWNFTSSHLLDPFVSTVTDLINEIAKIFQLENVDPKRFRLLECQGGKIKKTYDSRNESLTPINTEKSTLYLEEIEGVELMIRVLLKTLNPKSHFLLHFWKESNETIRNSIQIRNQTGEPVKKLKTRLALKLATPSDTLYALPLLRPAWPQIGRPCRNLVKIAPWQIRRRRSAGHSDEWPRKQRSNSGFDGAIRFRK